MSTATITDTRDKTETPEDTDNLTHLLCQVCKRTAKRRAQPPKALCGYTRFGWIEGKVSTEQPLCLVCHEMTERPCPKCGIPLRMR